jgi:hypothetical protein
VSGVTDRRLGRTARGWRIERFHGFPGQRIGRTSVRPYNVIATEPPSVAPERDGF